LLNVGHMLAEMFVDVVEDPLPVHTPVPASGGAFGHPALGFRTHGVVPVRGKMN
jgi:hypothetical protein